MRRSVLTFLCLVVLLVAAPAGAQVTYQIVTTIPGAGGSSFAPVLLRGTDGNLYGVIDRGGAFSRGYAFKVDSGGVRTVLHDFTVFEGRPVGLTQASDGNLYGTSYDAGALTIGGVFRLTTTGVYTLLHTFTGFPGGHRPHASLIEGSDGWLYGTHGEGGLCGNCGGVFKISTSGSYVSLHAFATTHTPMGALVEASDGNFYGTTWEGGVSNMGTVFRLTPAGVVTIIHSFSGADGHHPRSGLIEGTDGRLYGTTFHGGASSVGEVYAIDLSGSVTVLHSFNGTDGLRPWAALVQASDGNLYGTTEANSVAACAPFGTSGKLFRISTTGTGFSLLHSFGCPVGDGLVPNVRLVEGPLGTLHGMTPFGASPNGGFVYRVTFAVSTTTSLNVTPTSAVYGEPVTLTATVTGGTPTGSVRFFDGATDIGVVPVAAGVAMLNPTLAVGAHSFTAQFEATGPFVDSTSDPVGVTVAAAPTTTLLSVSPGATLLINQPVTFTATVDSATGSPTGSVQFFNGATSLGVVPLSAGSALLALPGLPIGVHAISVTYLGDGNFAGSTSAAANVTVSTVYVFGGFEQPLLPDGSASIQQNKAGRTIPVKFQLTLNGAPTGAAVATIAVYKVLDIALGTVDTTDLTEDAGAANETTNVFRYDTVAQQYIYNLKTKGWQAPATYCVVVTLSDGGVYTVNFSLR